MIQQDCAEIVVCLQNKLGESPVWCDDSQCLFWVDVARPGLLWRWHASSQVRNSWQFKVALTNLTLAQGGRLLVASERRLFLFDPVSGTSEHGPDIPTLQLSHRFNDGACDSNGRLWIGTMANNLIDRQANGPVGKVGDILCVTTEGKLFRFNEHLGCPNALAWSPDGLTFYFADSADGCIYSSIFDVETGRYSKRCYFFSAPSMGVPDGAAVDIEGYLWNARWGAGCVVRIAPDGTLDRVVSVPATFVTSCVFGGSDHQTLYITTAKNCDMNPFAGSVFSYRTPTAGLPPGVFGRASHLG